MSLSLAAIAWILGWQRLIFYDKEIQTEWNLMRLSIKERPAGSDVYGDKEV